MLWEYDIQDGYFKFIVFEFHRTLNPSVKFIFDDVI